MIRSNSIWLTTALSAALLFGCNKAADEQRKADEARVEANRDVAEANRQANEKINDAVAKANEKVAEAESGFAKLRDDYRERVTKELAGIDKDISNLEAKVTTATGKEKAEIERNLPTIHALRDNVSAEYGSLERATAPTWDATKQRVDKAIDELKKAVDKVA